MADREETGGQRAISVGSDMPDAPQQERPARARAVLSAVCLYLLLRSGWPDAAHSWPLS